MFLLTGNLKVFKAYDKLRANFVHYCATHGLTAFLHTMQMHSIIGFMVRRPISPGGWLFVCWEFNNMMNSNTVFKYPVLSLC